MFQLRSMLAGRERQPQRVEQRLALAPGARLQRLGPGGEVRPRRAGREEVGRGGQQLGIGDHRRQRAAADLPPAARVLEPGEVAADRLPEGGVDPAQAQLAQPARHRRERQVVQHGGREARQVVEHEPGRRAAVGLEREAGHELGLGPGGIGGTRPCPAPPAPARSPGSIPCSRKLRRLKAPSRLEKPRPSASPISGRCANRRRRPVQRREDGELERGVGDVVLAADDVGDAEIRVVDRRGEQVGGGAVLAAEHGVAQVPGGEAAAAQDQVVEGELAPRAGAAASAAGAPRPSRPRVGGARARHAGRSAAARRARAGAPQGRQAPRGSRGRDRRARGIEAARTPPS